LIRQLRELPAEQQRKLIGLLDPECDLARVDDGATGEALRRTLRAALQVPDSGELGEVLRRRLVQLTVKQFGLASTESELDLHTDLELAGRIIGFLLVASYRLATTKELRNEFEKFAKTKDPAERRAWLVQSQLFALAIERRTPVPAELRLGSQPSGYKATTKAMLDHLKVVAMNNYPEPEKLAELASPAIIGKVPRSARALTLAAVAGGVYMAGLRQKEHVLQRGPTDETRAQRARRSKLVQNVVMVCAFAVADEGVLGATPPPTRGR
jgi:hypothetical protein